MRSVSYFVKYDIIAILEREFHKRRKAEESVARLVSIEVETPVVEHITFIHFAIFDKVNDIFIKERQSQHWEHVRAGT